MHVLHYTLLISHELQFISPVWRLKSLDKAAVGCTDINCSSFYLLIITIKRILENPSIISPQMLLATM